MPARCSPHWVMQRQLDMAGAVQARLCWADRAAKSGFQPICGPALLAAPAQTVAFCGVFPELKRAWASVDNSLFLWRFDKWCGPGCRGQPCPPACASAAGWVQSQILLPGAPLALFAALA